MDSGFIVVVLDGHSASWGRSDGCFDVLENCNDVYNVSDVLGRVCETRGDNVRQVCYATDKEHVLSEKDGCRDASIYSQHEEDGAGKVEVVHSGKHYFFWIAMSS